MDVQPLRLEGLFVLTPRRFGDDRGFFSESWNRQRMKDAGFDLDFVQDNHSLSRSAGTVRGLHGQAPPRAQDKLVRCGRGVLFDVAVDVRQGSPTFGQWEGVELSHENGKQLLVPRGFLHGFMTLSDDTEIIYKCTDYYNPETEVSVRWDDPELAIAWPKEMNSISDADRNAAALATWTSPFTMDGAS